MKYNVQAFLLLASLSVNLVNAQSNKGWVLLKGTVKNFNNQVEVQDMSEMSDLLLPDPERFFVPDSTGNFSIRFSLSAPNYFRLGRNILYLTPGDSLVLFVDYKNPKLATFKGKHSSENEYLRETPFPKGGSFLNAGELTRRTIDSTALLVEAAAATREKSLASYQNLSKEFIRLETGRIKADILNSLFNTYVYGTFKYKLSKDSAESYLIKWKELIKPYQNKYNQHFIDPTFLKLVVYRDVAAELIAAEKQNTRHLQQLKEWMQAYELGAQLKRASDRETKLSFEPKIKALNIQAYREALQNTLTKVLQLSNGDMAVDFIAADQNNKLVHLAGLKGKLIYIDIWATWCGPCMEEMPAYEKLKESFNDDNRIQFISLSIDDDQSVWLNNVKKRNAQGLQWIIDRTKLLSYNIIGIPRSILVDQYFKIVEMNAALPSSKKLAVTLDQLLK